MRRWRLRTALVALSGALAVVAMGSPAVAGDPVPVTALTGTVTEYSTGNPIESVNVGLYNGGTPLGSDVTDSSGDYTIPVDDGNATLTVIFAESGYIQRYRDFTTQTGGGPYDVDIVLAQNGDAATVQGTVTNITTGFPLEGVIVNPYDSAGATGGQDVTDASGFYQLVLTPDEWDLDFDAGGEFFPQILDLTLEPGSRTRNVALVPRSGDMPAKNFEVTQGSKQAGGLASLFANDTNRLEIRSEKTNGKHRTRWVATYANIHPQPLELGALLAAKSSASCVHKIDGWNVDSLAWDNVDSTNVGSQKKPFVAEMDVNGDFVDGVGLGKVKLRYTCVRDDGPFTMKVNKARLRYVTDAT